MAQWDKSLPLYFARLYNKPDQYQKALQLIRESPQDGGPPEIPGDALSGREWRKLFNFATRAESLRKLFADGRDPFSGAHANEISLLEDVSDLTTDAFKCSILSCAFGNSQKKDVNSISQAAD